MTAGTAWYKSSREGFLAATTGDVVATLANQATREGWHIEPEQHEEWVASIRILQNQLAREVQVLQAVLSDPSLQAYESIILEYDMRRRGLRIDGVLLGKGVIAVLEFKRSVALKGHFDQIENYCVNLIEFHAETRRLCEQLDVIMVPVLVQTDGTLTREPVSLPSFMPAPWHCIARPAFVSSRTELAEVLQTALAIRRGDARIDADAWLDARFAPSSTILDAALSLYGQHDVSAILTHAAPVDLIEKCAQSVLTWIRTSSNDGQNRIVFVSGAPGSGKTLLGLKIVFSQEFRSDTVFVTGNAPLVDVLSAALQRSYAGNGSSGRRLAGYPKESARHVIANSTFKIVKAHNFLGDRGTATGSSDGRIIVFDEAQRTYEKGRRVLRTTLEDDEAVLILLAQEKSYSKGCVVVALVGHNQFINSGELGVGAWIRAAKRRDWRCVIADDTLALLPESDRNSLCSESFRDMLDCGHLPHSLRYYRNLGIERWASALLDGDLKLAQDEALALKSDDVIWLTRELGTAKEWARSQRIGEERIGLIGSGKGARLAAEGLFVGLKPSIADWILSPDGDVRSSNALETIQNQYQIQGLELDYTIVCWDLDLRRKDGVWGSYAFSGSKWQRRTNDLPIAKNGYRVLLTRARRGMIVFVPSGDLSGADQTRPPDEYNAIADYLLNCGAREWKACANAH